MSSKSRGLKVVLKNDFLWFASILMLMCSVLATSFFYFNVNGRQEEERAWLESYSQSFLKDLQLGDVASVEAKIKRFTQRHGFKRVEVTSGKNVIIADGVTLQFSGLFDTPFTFFYSKLSDASVVEVNLKDPVGTLFGNMKITYYPHKFYRTGVSSALVIIVTFISLFLVIFGLYIRRLSDVEDPFLSLTGAIRRMKKATEGPTESIDSRLDSALVRTGIIEMDLLQKEFSASLASTVRLQKELNDSQVAAAIARTTQALAHDVRRPFSMFKSIIQSVEAAEDPSTAKNLLRVALPEVNQAMASVEGMIEDVMQIGNRTEPTKEEVSPESLIHRALAELFRVYPDADIWLSYKLNHRHFVMADSLRMVRVFSNIIGNAIQAIEQKGQIWVETHDRDGFVEFTIGNAGSVISKEDMHKLFEAFFTSGKRDGTGLGLAIAKKIVETHGGSIRCFSDLNSEFPDGKVEFIFTLPAGKQSSLNSSLKLPCNLKNMHSPFQTILDQPGTDDRTIGREVELEHEILSRLEKCKTKPSILLVDDESVYLNGLVSHIEKSVTLSSVLEITTARTDQEAIQIASLKKPILVIEDIDLGVGSENGIDVVRRLRSTNFKGQICIHSNRFLFEDTKTAMDAGANTVLPKPMSRVHLLTLILAALPENQETDLERSSKKKNFAYIDDSLIFLLGMKMKSNGDAVCHEFQTATAFLQKVDNEIEFLSNLDFILTDYYLSPTDSHNGLSLAGALRSKGFNRPIVLASDAEVNATELTKFGIDAVIPKSKLEWKELHHQLASLKVR